MLIISADRRELADAISRAAAGLSPRPQQPVQAGMLLRGADGTLELTCSDGQVSFTSQIEAAIHTGGSVILPGKMLAEVSRYWTGQEIVLIHEDKGVAEIVFARSRFSLPATPGEKYPQWLPAPEALLELDAEAFSRAVRSIIPAASTTFPVLQSIYLIPGRELKMICASRECMGIVNLPGFPGDIPSHVEPVLVPVKVMERFARIAGEGTVSLGWSGKLISMAADGLQVVTPLIEGSFADWEKIAKLIPVGTVTANTAELANAVKMAMLADERVSLEFTEGEILVSSLGEDGRAGSSVPLEEEDIKDPVTFAFGGDMLLDALAGCGEKAGFSWNRAVFVQDGNFIYSVQPRRRET